jgi:hypothetical protein
MNILIKFVRLRSENTVRNRLDQEILGSSLRVATSQICPDIDISVVKKVFQSHR